MIDRFDAFTMELGKSAPRRRVLRALGGIAAGSLAVAGIDRVALANSCKNRCKRNCKNKHKNKSAKQCRKRCQNKCN